MFLTCCSPLSSKPKSSLSRTWSRTTRLADPARLGQGFEPCGDIDAVAVDVAPVFDDIAEIDTDAELDPPLHRNGGVAHGHLALHIHRAAHCIDDAAELPSPVVLTMRPRCSLLLGS